MRIRIYVSVYPSMHLYLYVLYLSKYILMNACILIYVCWYTYLLCMYAYVFIYIHVCMYVYSYILSIYICTYVSVYASMCACMNLCITRKNSFWLNSTSSSFCRFWLNSTTLSKLYTWLAFKWEQLVHKLAAEAKIISSSCFWQILFYIRQWEKM
jgi:hypothetical protein